MSAHYESPEALGSTVYLGRPVIGSEALIEMGREHEELELIASGLVLVRPTTHRRTLANNDANRSMLEEVAAIRNDRKRTIQKVGIGTITADRVPRVADRYKFYSVFQDSGSKRILGIEANECARQLCERGYDQDLVYVLPRLRIAEASVIDDEQVEFFKSAIGEVLASTLTLGNMTVYTVEARQGSQHPA